MCTHNKKLEQLKGMLADSPIVGEWMPDELLGIIYNIHVRINHQKAMIEKIVEILDGMDKR